jgi:hypothetical protein
VERNAFFICMHMDLKTRVTPRMKSYDRMCTNKASLRVVNRKVLRVRIIVLLPATSYKYT